MAAYLEEHPPARSQYRRGRRATPTGTVVMHTAENSADLVGNDAGAERIAAFIAGRTDAPGSYHLIGDRDSQILLVPFEWEAFHDGTGSNPWSIGISLAITAAWFRTASDGEKLWYMARLATMARTASDWLEANHGITVPARRLTKASQREAGFCTHMDRERWEGTPGRRSDPWGDSDEMWHLFLTLYEDTARPVPGEEDDEVAKLAWFKDDKGGTHAYLVAGVTASHVPNQKALDTAKFIGTEWSTSPDRSKAVGVEFYGSLAILTGPLRNV